MIFSMTAQSSMLLGTFCCSSSTDTFYLMKRNLLFFASYSVYWYILVFIISHLISLFSLVNGPCYQHVSSVGPRVLCHWGCRWKFYNSLPARIHVRVKYTYIQVYICRCLYRYMFAQIWSTITYTRYLDSTASWFSAPRYRFRDSALL